MVTSIIKHEHARIKIRNYTKLLVFISFVLVFFSVLPSAARAATLYFSPSSGSYAVSSLIVVNIYVSSADQAMNAASGVISFPTDKLAVESISKSGSIISLWVQEPTFSNTLGSVNFEGIVLNPGFTGASGKILSITFKTKAVGNAPINFFSGSVLANNGKGTNVLTGLYNANFSFGIMEPGAPEIVTPTEIAGAPTAPEISSPTHPDPNKWYAAKEAKFTWNVPKDVTGVRLLAGRIPQAVPTIIYSMPINSKEITDLADGIWYFHVRLQNVQGWGGVSHFRFQIDTEKPDSFDISEIERKDLTDPRAKFVFDASDKTSGIDYYKIQIGNENPQIWKDDGSGKYETPVLAPGKYTLIAKAVDKAGNSLANSAEFTVQALWPPEIIEYPRALQSGEILVAKGKTNYPNGGIKIWLQRENEEVRGASVKSDDKGKFIFIAGEKLKDGIYKLWAEAFDERGAKSEPSEKVTIAVEQPAFLRIGSWFVGFLSIIIQLIALALFLVYFAWYWWHKFATMRKRVKKEVREAEEALHKSFYSLKETIHEQIKMLEKTKTKRQLTEEEEKIIKQLKENLDDAEKFVRKEIEDIEKEVR